MSDFESTIKCHKLVLVDAYAEWCGPCRLIAPKINNFSNDYGDVHFIKFDVDAVPDIAKALNIKAMPTFIIFKDGEKIADVIGANPSAIQEQLNRISSSI
ncbi:hypothetical protein K3495_g14339 [Podosphaera aphanis]|nr:hypothetical protein K3495_g14339 [Podosphaera aphanis]